jgi:hypothetical protein
MFWYKSEYSETGVIASVGKQRNLGLKTNYLFSINFIYNLSKL